LRHIRTVPSDSCQSFDPQDTLLSSQYNDLDSSGTNKLDSNIVALSGLDASLTQSALQAHKSRNECIDETWLRLSQDQGFLKNLDSPIASFTSEFDRKENSDLKTASLNSEYDREKITSSSIAEPSFQVRIIASPIDLENIVFAVRLHSGFNSGEVADWPLKPERGMTRSAIIAEIADVAAEGGFAFEVVP
jgi:hypothetical protein